MDTLEAKESKETLLLESSSQSAAAPTATSSGSIKLNVSTNESVSLFDQLGPTIVSPQGTLSRIGNWAEMDELERSRVLRVLGARNKLRLEKVLADQEASGDGKA